MKKVNWDHPNMIIVVVVVFGILGIILTAPLGFFFYCVWK